MLRRFLSIILCVLCLFLSTFSSATVVDNLYTAQIPVADQSSQTRAPALTLAFHQVLVKVSGSTATLTNPEITNAFANTNNYVQQYSYVTNPAQAEDGIPYLLQVTFEDSAINSLLLKANLAVWGADRPLTLFWVARNSNNQAQLIGASSTGPIPTLVDQNAERRGLPILFPVLDLTDLNQLSVSDVMAPFVSVITQASVRYGSNAVVIVRFTQQGQKWNSFWTLVANSTLQNWRTQGTNLQVVIQQGMDNVVDALSSQFSLKNGSAESTVNIELSGVKNLTSYARAERYLNRLAPVKNVTLLGVQNNKVSFQLSLVGSLASLQQAIKLDHSLTLLPQVPVLASENTEYSSAQTVSLAYQWTP